VSGSEHPDVGGEALLEAVLDALPELVFLLDRQGRYVAVLGGRDAQRYHDGRSLVGRLLHEVMPAERADGFLARVHEALDADRVITFEYRLSSADIDGIEERPGVPDELWFEARVAPLAPSDGRADMVVWMLFNITESRLALQRLEQQQAVLERLARTDFLTGLLNRRAFFAESVRELAWVHRSGQPAVLITFDLDGFKEINDTWGHAAGDAVLRSVSRLLRSGRRDTDVLARLGGEEFALVVRGTELDGGRELAERLRDELAALRTEHEGKALSVTASFGVTEYRPTDEDPEDALRRADAAMYTAKRRGRDRVETDRCIGGGTVPTSD
jgi:two-component system, cell cycle response regulator